VIPTLLTPTNLSKRPFAYSGTLVLGNRSLLIVLSILTPILFFIIFISGFRKENSNKWSKYQLTLPVTRKMIALSKYISCLGWILLGTLIIIIGVLLAISLNSELYFTENRDVFTLVILSIGIPLLSGALFYPSIYQFGIDKTEILIFFTLIISCLFTLAYFSAVNYFIFKNVVDGSQISDPTYYFWLGSYFLFVILAEIISFLTTVKIYKNKQY